MNKLPAMLQAEYGINPIQIKSRQGGWASLAFMVKANDAVYFLKAYEKRRASTFKLTACIDQYVPVVVWLEKNGGLRGKVPAPLQTMRGKYKCEDEEHVYLLYPFIEGETIGNRDLTQQQIKEFAQIIATLHSFGEEIPFPTELLKETFEIPFVKSLEEVIRCDTEGASEELRSFPEGRREMVERWIGRIKELSEKMKSASWTMVLCHTDLHHWNLMQEENLLLIDWEGLKLAPAEADMIFLTDRPYFKQFMEVYQQYHGEYRMNKDALLFYQLRRKLEDIWEFTEQLLYEELDAKEKDKIIGFLTDLTDNKNEPLL